MTRAGVQITPNLSDYDQNNFFEVKADDGLNNRYGGKQVLYAEQDFPQIVYDMIVRGEEGYIKGFDGYALYQEMSWSALKVPLEGRGLFTSIPGTLETGEGKGYAGWACFFNDYSNYDCGSYFVPDSQLVQSDSIDLLNGDYEVDRGFWCDVSTDYIAYHTARCVAFLPEYSDKYKTGEYRWYPGDLNLISQRGFIGERDTWFNQFVPLGSIEFSGATALLNGTIGLAMVAKLLI